MAATEVKEEVVSRGLNIVEVLIYVMIGVAAFTAIFGGTITAAIATI